MTDPVKLTLILYVVPLNNDKAATILKMSECIHQHILPNTQIGGIWPLIILTVLGVLLCWIYQPKTRVDAFSRGFAVFAILAVSTPFQGIPEGFGTSPNATKPAGLLLWPNNYAFAQEEKIKTGEENVLTTIILKPSEKGDRIKESIVTIRDAATGKIVCIEKNKGNSLYIRKPPGKYKLEVECTGYKRVATEFKVNNHPKVYNLPVTATRVPIPIQRLLAPQKGELHIKQP